VQSSLTFETLTIAYLAALGIAAPLAKCSATRKVRAVAICGAGAAVILWIVPAASLDVRLWLGHAYLAGGYWVPALLLPPAAQAEATAFERWLIRCDERWRRFRLTSPARIVPLFEFAYLFCYAMVPVAFVLAWTRGAAADAGRFWEAVLLSGFVCYGSLPFLISRPPRIVNGNSSPTRSGIRAANAFVLGRVGHGLNTFPSGHVAVSLAAALEVLPLSTPAGAALLLIAVAIAIGAVSGAYHYATDAAFGLVIGAAASMLI
jgi:membrane-associated phospholipid phosphatase